MSVSLIINARDRLSWHQRLWSDASTVLMWGAWLKLWYPVVRGLARAIDAGLLAQLKAMHLFSAGHGAGVERYAFALAGASGTLLLWNQLPAFKSRTPEVPSVTDYANHFELPESEVVAGRGSAICVVHHDERGRIVRVEPRAA